MKLNHVWYLLSFLRREALLLLTFFICFHNKFHCHILNIKEYRCLRNVIHQIVRKSAATPFSNFYSKIWVGFCLNTGRFLRGFVLKLTERAWVALKTSIVLRVFLKAIRLRNRYISIWWSLRTWTFSKL